MNKKLAEQVFDSPYLKLFEDIVRSTTIQPAFIASKLTEDLINLQRQGRDMTPLNENIILDTFKRLDAGNIAKESVVLIFEKIMKKESKTVDEAIAALGITPINEQELQGTIDHILEQNMSIIRSKGIASLGMLMGRCMSVLRGRADGEKINSILKQKLEHLLSSNTELKKT
jgi:glutamyl-tRNA(Gln) amidotransferase subunit E